VNPAKPGRKQTAVTPGAAAGQEPAGRICRNPAMAANKQLAFGPAAAPGLHGQNKDLAMLIPLLFMAAAAGDPGQATRLPPGQPGHAVAASSPADWNFSVPPVPAPRNETVPLPPASSDQLIWHPGFWEWNGKAFEWTPGAWMKRPDTIGKENSWLPGHWQQTRPGSRSLVWIPGHWL